MRGKTICYARQALGLTQNGLAQLLNTTQLSVCRWELNKQKPSASAEKRIKQVLGLTEASITEIEELLLCEQHRQLQDRLRKQAQANI